MPDADDCFRQRWIAKTSAEIESKKAADYLRAREAPKREEGIA